MIALSALLSACSSRPEHALPVSLQTASPVWFDDLGQGPVINGQAYLSLPESGKANYPALIVLHTSQGLGRNEWAFEQEARARNMAVMLVDSFSPRGVHKVSEDQTVVSEISILQDLYAAKHYLEHHPRIDKERIAVIGFSKGGLPAIYSAFDVIDQTFNKSTNPFAAHIAFHPWCGLELQNLRTSGAPIRIHAGGKDTITPPERCKNLFNQVAKIDPDLDFEIFVYEDARHAFEHPILAHMPPLTVGYKIPKKCKIRQNLDGFFFEEMQGKLLNSKNFSKTINDCSEKGALVSGNPEAAETAFALVFKTLEAVFKDQRLKIKARDQQGQSNPSLNLQRPEKGV